MMLALQWISVFAEEPIATFPLARVAQESMRYIRVDNALELRIQATSASIPPFGSIVLLKHRTLTKVVARGAVQATEGAGLLLRVVLSPDVPFSDQLKEALRANYVALVYRNLEDLFFESLLEGKPLAPLILDGANQSATLELRNTAFWGPSGTADRLRRDLEELVRLRPEAKSDVAGWIRYEQLFTAIEQRIPAKYRDGSQFFARQKVRDYLGLRNELRKLAESGPPASSVGGLKDLHEDLRTLRLRADWRPGLTALAAKFAAEGMGADAEVLRDFSRGMLVAIVEGFLDQNALWSDAKQRRNVDEALRALGGLSPGGDDRLGSSVEGLRRRLTQVDSVVRLRGLLSSQRPEEILKGLKDYSALPVLLQAGVSRELLLAAKAKTELAERAERALGTAADVAALQALLSEVNAAGLELSFSDPLQRRLTELRRAAAEAEVVAKRTALREKINKGAEQPATAPQDSSGATARAPSSTIPSTPAAPGQFEVLINPPVSSAPALGAPPASSPPEDDREALNAARVLLLDEFRGLTTRVRAGLSIGNAPVATYSERLNQFAKELAAIAPRLEALREGGPVYSAELRSLAEIVVTAINSFTEVKRMCDGLEAQLQGLGAGQGFRPEYVRQVEQEAAALRTRHGPFLTVNSPFRDALDDLVRRVKEREIVRRAPAPKRIL